jgi:pimeloyl-ACP methyl ester carboxylesterase
VEAKELEARGGTYRVREHGDGDPVILLHGFPETSKMWERIMPALADAGYHCLAPDMRGYSPGARPSEVEAYRYEELAADVFSIAEAAGFDRFHLVGHDWGALVGWCTLAVNPEPIVSWTAMSVAHYAGAARAVWDDPEQELYRGILKAFTDPATAPAMAANDCAGMRFMWSDASDEEISDYVSVFRDPAGLQAALNYYVACDSHRRCLNDPTFVFGPVSTPTLLLWGKNDVAVRGMTVELAEPYMTGPYRLVVMDAGHFLVQEKTEQVRDEVLAHLKENPL